MDQARFEQMVARLERESDASPRSYQLKVAALALLGFLILALIVGVAGFGLVLLAGIAVATLLTGGKALILLFKLGKLLLVLAIPLWLLVRSASQALFTRLPPPQGLELRRAEAPALFAAMDGMRRGMKGPRFHHVLVTDEMNAAVVQRPLFGLFGFPRNYLILGLPLLEALSAEEALAVVAHEYGHLAGSHSRFAAYIYRLRHSWGTIQAVAQQWQGWTGRPLQRIVGWYAPYFNAYTFVLARANEYQADAASAELVGAGVAASALKRVNISASQYDAFVESTLTTIRDLPAPPADLSAQWAARALQAPPAERAEQWLRRALERESQASDTHPVLRERLRALTGHAVSASELPAPVAASAALAWLGSGVAGLRETLQRQWHERVAQPWAQRHQELQTRLRRLEELEAMAEPDVDARIERLRLRIDLHPEIDHLPALVAFNAERPDTPLTLFLEGCVRLDQGDEGGIGVLERTIALDADATRPACEKIHAWLSQRADARAGAWADRWKERLAFEEDRSRQMHTLDLSHELRASGLGEAEIERAREVLRMGGEGVQRAFLARRVLPADPSIATYVLGLELTRWAAFRSKGPEIVKRLTDFEWPVHVFVCAMVDEHKALRTKLEALPGAQVVFR
ncbi:MAG TPA: M48 family metallopeptidase [Albitalea sp.]|uniref:M48 family metallopeptidase n=1 Tax=Piscinibacter sp. TaxID=1903157 RepID=UPI002ED5D97D